jgi:hypothetical protein
MNSQTVVTILLVLCHILTAPWLAWLDNSVIAVPLGKVLVLGLWTSQTCLISLWLVMPPHARLFQQGAKLVLAAVLFRLLFGVVGLDRNGGMLLLTTGILVFALALLVRRRGMRIQTETTGGPFGTWPWAMQFSLAEMLAVVTIVAMGIALLPIAATWLPIPVPNQRDLVAIAACSTATCWIVVWAVLGTTRFLWRLLVSTPLLVAVAAASSATEGEIVALYIGLVAVVIGMTLLPYRFCGYRLVAINRQPSDGGLV